VTATRKGKPTRLGEALAGYLKSAGLAERIGQAEVVDAWPALVGERIAHAAAPESVTPDGTLFVRVKSSAWRQELSLMTPEVLALINTNRTAGRIKRIRWLVGTESAADVAVGLARRRPRR
jgi:predicted nucleic acid-binding Zn ribbon protein